MAFQRRETQLAGLAVLERTAHEDARGRFRRLFCSGELAAMGWREPVVQVNHSLTRIAGTVRGIHFQHPPHAEDKLVTCVAGSVWDVAVDLRRDSPTFLHWHAEVLSEDNGRSLLIPKGFGHGFQVLADEAALVYLHSAAYHPEAEGGLHPADPRLAIAWPQEVRGLSAKDAARRFLATDFLGIAL